MFSKIFITAFLAWISFFPEPIQVNCQVFVKSLLISVFFFFWAKGEIIFFKRRDLPLLIFLLSILPGIISSQNKLVAIETYSNIALPLFSLYFLGRIFFSSKKDILNTTKIICLFSSLVAVLGLFDIWLGENIIYAYLMHNPFYDRYIAHTSLRRPLSTQFNPAVLGTYLLACLPFALVLIREKKFVLRLLGFISIILAASVLILTFSRAAFVGLVVALIFFFWHRGKKLAVLLLLLAFIITIGVSSFLKPGRGFDRFGTKGLVFGQNYTSPLSRYRVERTEMAFKMLKDHPFFGIGLNQIRIRFFDYYPKKAEVGYEWRIADNMYLTLLAETGMIGFLGFLFFIFSLFKEGLCAFHKSVNERGGIILLVGLSALLGILVNMAGYELFYWHIPFYLFSFLSGLVSAQFQEDKIVRKR